MKHPTLKIEKTEDASITWGDYGASRPQGPGDWSYKQPATYQVTGPTGRTYTVTGMASGWMQRPNWYYEYTDDKTLSACKGGYATRAACLNAIAKLERAAQ